MSEKLIELDELLAKAIEALDKNCLHEAIGGFIEAFQGYDQLGEVVKAVRCDNLLGITYAALSNDAMAVDYYLNGMDYLKTHNIKGGEHLFYNNIGSRYQELGDDEKALEYFEKGQKDLDEHGNEFPGELSPGWYVVGYLNIGLSYFHLGKLEEAEAFLTKAVAMSEKYDYHSYDFTIICVLSRVYLSMGSDTYARVHLDEMMEHATKVETYVNDYTQDVLEFTALLKELKEYGMWETCLKVYDDLAEEQKNPTVYMQAVEFWIEYYEALGMEKEREQMCIYHMKLYLEHKKVNDKEKIMALNSKIELKFARDFLRDAEKKSERDPLTGLENRYALQKYGKEIIQLSADNQAILAIGILDIDCFKMLNDTYGHLCGDEALKRVSHILFECMDGYGTVYRFGGDEFVLMIMNGTDYIVEKLSNKIMNAIKEAHIANENSPINRELTVSMGLYCAIPNENSKIDDFLDQADTALYQVKKHGRNRYTVNK
ncbi:MAG: tetratricopeptide repeat-containing diguanylate cyclase [Lachnospiraceae bacterium]